MTVTAVRRVPTLKRGLGGHHAKANVTDMFVHLHVHSAYSGLGGVAGASSLEALAAAAVERGMSTLALTDTNGVWGAMDFRRVADAYGLTPV